MKYIRFPMEHVEDYVKLMSKLQPASFLFYFFLKKVNIICVKFSLRDPLVGKRKNFRGLRL